MTNLDEAVATWARLFGAELENRETLSDQGVESALMRLGDGRIELLARSPDTPVSPRAPRPGMHHVAFEVDDIADELERLAASGAS